MPQRALDPQMAGLTAHEGHAGERANVRRVPRRLTDRPCSRPPERSQEDREILHLSRRLIGEILVRRRASRSPSAVRRAARSVRRYETISRSGSWYRLRVSSTEERTSYSSSSPAPTAWNAPDAGDEASRAWRGRLLRPSALRLLRAVSPSGQGCIASSSKWNIVFGELRNRRCGPGSIRTGIRYSMSGVISAVPLHQTGCRGDPGRLVLEELHDLEVQGVPEMNPLPRRPCPVPRSAGVPGPSSSHCPFM